MCVCVCVCVCVCMCVCLCVCVCDCVFMCVCVCVLNFKMASQFLLMLHDDCNPLLGIIVCRNQTVVWQEHGQSQMRSLWMMNTKTGMTETENHLTAWKTVGIFWTLLFW